jgi:hypothetical protein
MEEELARRLALLEDERAILRTMHAYPHAIDYGRESAWVDCFTEDGVFDVRDKTGTTARVVAGRDELVAFAAGFSRPPDRWHKHLLIEPLIEVDGDTARASAYFAVLVEHEDAPVPWVFGRYRDTLVRGSDGGWRFRERISEVESVRPGMPPLAFSRQPAGSPTIPPAPE